MMTMPENDYWLNKLNVHIDQIEKHLALNSEQEIEQLKKKWDERISKLIANELGLSNRLQSDRKDFVDIIFNEYPEECRQFIYLTEFAKRKRKESVLIIARDKLHPDLLQTLELADHDPNAKDILWLLCELYCQDPESLFDVFLKDIELNHSAGTWFQINSNGDGISPEMMIGTLKHDQIEKALAQIDVPDAISCIRVVDREHEKVIFLNAEVTAKTTKLRNLRNQGYIDDWIMVRFNKQKNRVLISARSLDKGAGIVQGLIQKITQTDCTLLEEEKATPAEKIRQFVKTLLEDTTDSILLETELDNAPIDGVGTKIRLKNDFSIARPLAALNDRYNWLDQDDDMQRMHYLKFKYCDKIFKLTFHWLDSVPLNGFVRSDDHRISPELLEEFKQYMQDTYGINICCKRRRFSSNGVD